MGKHTKKLSNFLWWFKGISWVTFYSIVSGYSDIKLESNKQYIFKEFWVKDKITMEIRKYFEENNEDKT